jgi:hypothetical protein
MISVFAGGETNLQELQKPGGAFEQLIEPKDIVKVVVRLLSGTASHVNGINIMIGETTP